MPQIPLSQFLSGLATSALAPYAQAEPWSLTQRAGQIVRDMMAGLSSTDYAVDNGVAVHRSATVEPGAVLKGPLILGPDCFVATGAYIRGGCWLQASCVIGPGCELKSSFVFAGTRLAHFNFVGDSILGSAVNLEAGSLIANYRNELENKAIHIRAQGRRHATGVDKFGALVGDNTKIGANAVLAPGTLLAPGSVVARLQLVDQACDEN